MDLVKRIEQDIEQQALRAMGSAAAMFDSLDQLAILFLDYYGQTEQHGWQLMMLHDAREKTFALLPNGTTNPWQQLKEKSRAAFQKYPIPTGSLPLQ